MQSLRMMAKIFIAAAALFCLSPLAVAQEVPPYLVQQGRLMDALNTPVNGTRDLTFNLYAEETGGTAFWTETQTVLLTDGFYSVTLGEGQNLDLAQFSGATLYLGVTIDGEELTPRLALRSVPYAIKAGVAQNVTGDITPTSVTVGGANGTVIDASGVSVGGNVIIDASGEWSGPAPTVSFNDLLDRPFTLNDLNCTDGQIPQIVGGAWTCTPASAADTLSGLGCSEGDIPAFIGGVWTCATDTDTNTTYAPGTGITITGANNNIAVDTNAIQVRVGSSCAAGASIRQINSDGTVACEDDTDTNTTYAAGAGITITGATNDIAVDTTTIQGRVTGSCATNESIRQINADGSVSCEPDSDTIYSAATGGGLVLSGGNAFGIGADAITSARIADGAVATADLANDAVTSAKILDGAVSLNDLAVNSVDSAKILDGSVGTTDLANTSVSNAKLADGAVTTAKIVDANVTTAKLADGSVNSAKILDGSIVAADIDNTSVQQRVGGACAANESIRQINANGTVTCEPDTDTIYTAGTGIVLTGTQFSANSTYIRSEAVTAMNAKANNNPLHHDRYTDAEAIAAASTRGFIGYTICQTDNDNGGDVGTEIISCPVTKRFSDSVLKVTYSDNLRSYGHDRWCQWEVEFDGQRCSGPTPAIRSAVYNSSSNDAGDWNNDHQARTVVGMCQTIPAGNLNAGAHTVRVRISDGNADCYTGWNQTTILLVEEIRP